PHGAGAACAARQARRRDGALVGGPGHGRPDRPPLRDADAGRPPGRRLRSRLVRRARAAPAPHARVGVPGHPLHEGGVVSELLLCELGEMPEIDLPDDSVDLVLCSPPYEARRSYGIGFNLRGEAWVEWAVKGYLECLRVCRGLV